MNKKKLDAQWKQGKGKVPRVDELWGEYNVEIVSGCGRVLSHLTKTWVKEFYPEDVLLHGHNIVDEEETGYFDCFWLGNSMLLEYSAGQNFGIWSRLKDYIRRSEEEGKYLGKIYLRFWGKYRFMGYFTLTKIEDKNEDKL